MGFWNWLDNRLCTAANIAILAAAAAYSWSAADRIRLGDSPGNVVILSSNDYGETRIARATVRLLGGMCVVTIARHYSGHDDVQIPLRADGTAGGGSRWTLADG
jgi:hypothetical protein